MKRSITTIFALAIYAVATSQTASWSWAKQGTGPSDDYAHALATDPSGNVITTGVFSGTTMVFGTHTLSSFNVPNSHAEPNKDIFLVKYDKSGNIVWALSGGGPEMERSYAIDTDASGNIYIGGSSSSTVLTLGTVTVNKDKNEDFFVAKLDNAGNTLWIKTGVGNSQNYVQGLAADPSGNVVVTGFNIGTEFAIGTTTISNPSGAVFVAKYDTQGNVLWAKSSFQNSDSYFAYSQSVDIDSRLGDIFVGGYYANKTLAFDSHTITNNKYGIDPTEDIFIVKYNSAGNVMWAKSFGGEKNERGMAVAVATSPDPYFSSDVYLAGHFGGAVLVADSKTLTNTNPALGNQDIFVLKLEAHTGKVMWASQLGGSGRDLVNDMETIGNAGVVLLGTFASSVINSGTLTSGNTYAGGNSTDIGVAGLDMNGHAVLLKTAGGASIDEGGGIAVDKESLSVYANGFTFSEPMYFDAFEINSTGVDVFTAKLSAPEYERLVLLGVSAITASEWAVGPNPTSGELRFSADALHENVNVVVYNMFGQEVLQQQFQSSADINIDLSVLSSGVYNVSLITKDSHTIVKVIRN